MKLWVSVLCVALLGCTGYRCEPDVKTLTRVAALKLTYEAADHSWRCAGCLRMKRKGDWQVWIEDGVLLGDPLWSVAEANREHKFNGNFSAWCLDCFRTFPGPER